MKGVYRMPGSRYWWYRWTDPDGKRHAVSLKTDDEAEAIKLARSIGVESVSQPRQSSITPVLDRYFSEARLRNRKPMRPETARTNRYVLQKYIHDQDLNLLSDISSNSLDRWLAGDASRPDDGDRWRSLRDVYAERFGPEASVLGPPKEWEEKYGDDG